jgi:hypothetical protein
MDPRFALLEGFGQWLDEIAGGRYVRQGSPLDPYRTSFRYSGKAVPSLDLIEHGQLPRTRRAAQYVSDLKNAHLVTKSPGVPPTLTALGRLVLQGWRDLGDCDDDEAGEVARAALLVRLALSLGDEAYQTMYSFWRELVEVRPAVSWFDEVPGLYLASYLNATSSGGYNPYRVLRALGDTFAGEMEIWREWAGGPESPAQLKRFFKTLDEWAPRAFGRRSFCQGMEAVRLTVADTPALPTVIREWTT